MDRAEIKARLAKTLTCPRCPDTPLLKRENLDTGEVEVTRSEEGYCPKCDYYVTFKDAVGNVSKVLDELKEEFTAELRDIWQEIVSEMDRGADEEVFGECAEPADSTDLVEASDLKMVDCGDLTVVGQTETRTVAPLTDLGVDWAEDAAGEGTGADTSSEQR